MLDLATMTKGIHTCKDIFVEMQPLLHLGDTTMHTHEGGIQEIQMSIV